MSLIEIKNIKKTYGCGENEVKALRGINLNVDKGDFLAIMGPSGSGKSTLLNILGFLDKPTEGEYIFNGEKTDSLKDAKLAKYRNSHVGFVVQNFALIDDYTIFQNVKVPLDYAHVSSKEKKKRIEYLLKIMGIEDKKNKLPKELSGGQNQRAAIARALVNSPDIILADEPTGALDRKNSDEIMKVFKKLNDEGKTIIIITHDERVGSMCKKIVYIEDGMVKEIEK
ncbi:MAG: ABC transporter ATP-binding protein [Inconstantimicrobium porci]|uniref:ABC transporter ATP-binding protein n=1 Tax=Inconstantimicrobium porci TaxID=2652291 RepID=A0A7X2MWG6_9CLOT|nr:ABC transporter ATP-binding protein [Inconstantimicrobium porci]MDY5911605.1 ABC transporter ATP-binding protein [Inconstantimicrobium porci]MSR90354.1 ABC transporter ATP-binding protein [Inconstantimicrobium porci]